MRSIGRRGKALMVRGMVLGRVWQSITSAYGDQNLFSEG